MKKLIITFLFSCLAGYLPAQQVFTWKQCMDAAVKSSPLSAQQPLYASMSETQKQNIAIAKLPQVSVNGQATYQSAVTKLPINLPNFTVPEIPKEQYKLTLDANQLIYGGGAVALQKQMEDANLQLNAINNETDLYKLREKANQLYFNILLVDKNKETIENTVKSLQGRYEKVSAGVKNGVMLPSAAELLQAEILKAGQRIEEAKAQRKSLIATLKVITGMAIPYDAAFEMPDIALNLAAYNNNRPEYRTFDVLEKKIDASQKLLNVKNLPKVFGFGTGGYGRPGLNMFKTDAGFFYIFGLKAAWNFWDWRQTSRERNILELSRSLLQNQKQAYDLATRSQLQQYLIDVDKFNILAQSDEKIIALRKSITQASASQLDNGVITASDFVDDQLAEEQAIMALNMHKIQLLQAKALYLAATGSL